MKQNYELTGQKIQGYTISKPIGQGKFSIVYRAENEQGLTFALKKIKIFDMADQKQRDKCLKEVELMKRLNHTNIIKYIDSFIHNNELIIVTEWAEKGDLKKMIKEKESDDLHFDEQQIWQYMKQISSALRHMHEKRIMHRDLKPANIFISSDLSLKIGDLGLSRSFSSETLQAYSKVGTPLYMSPELIQDSGYNQNADVWSLGCIVYELAELTSPFRSKQGKMSLMDLFENITNCNYRPLSSRYSSQLREIIRKMIVVDPSRRWSSEQVYLQTVKTLENFRKPLLDPIIAMDDIYIKLGLLNYQTNFCKFAEKKTLHKLYFAVEVQEKDNGQLFYFLELAYWIMALSKPQKKKEKLPLYTKTLINWNSPEDACFKFLNDLEGYGIKVEDISVDHLRNGYGQSVCYLLNQVLNRELIRSNFQFRKPKEALDEKVNDSFEEEKKNQKEVEEETRSLSESSDSIEQTQFETSVIFPNRNRRQRALDGALIDKIQEIEDEEGKMMIIGRADEKQWRSQCLRLEKKFTQITLEAKEARKKNGYRNSQTARISSAKMTDFVKYIKPAMISISNKIDGELEILKKGQNAINSSYSGITANYSENNQLSLQLNNRSMILSNQLKDSSENLEKTQEKLDLINQKLKMATNQTQNNRVKEIKAGLQNLKKQIISMDQKREIVSYELRKHMFKQKNNKDDYLEINYFDEA